MGNSMPFHLARLHTAPYSLQVQVTSDRDGESGKQVSPGMESQIDSWMTASVSVQATLVLAYGAGARRNRHR